MSEYSLEYLSIMREAGKTYSIKFIFDNDFENYSVSEGDLINIRTEKDYDTDIFINPIEFKGFKSDAGVSAFFTFLIELDPL